MNMNKSNREISDKKQESETEIVRRLIKIKESLSEIDRLTKLMMKHWETEEGEMFFYAYKEFKSGAESLINSCEKDVSVYKEIEDEIASESDENLASDLIS